MALFKRWTSGPRGSKREDLARLREWTSARTGVEAFVEPQTTVSETTVVLVAHDGEWTRRRMASPKAAADFARKVGIPVYDANRVGYPQRMREYNVRQTSGASGTAGSGPAAGSRRRPASGSASASPSAPRPRSSAERAAIVTLAVSAGVDAPTGDPGEDDLRRMWKQARSRSHPDRRGGDRTEWDQVEDAAKALRLTND